MAWRDEDGGKMEVEEGRREEKAETKVVDRVNWINAGHYVEYIQSCISESIPSISPVHHCLFLLTVPSDVDLFYFTSTSTSSLNFNFNANFQLQLLFYDSLL